MLRTCGRCSITVMHFEIIPFRMINMTKQPLMGEYKRHSVCKKLVFYLKKKGFL